MADRFLDLACRSGLRLVDDAIRAEGRATWLGDDKVPIEGEWEVVHRSVDGGLYGGTAGIALFLARLWEVTGDPACRKTALEAIAHASAWAGRGGRGGSLYSGIGGVAAAAAEVAVRCEDARSAAVARSLAGRVVDGSFEPASDLISGEAGRLLAALEVGRRLGLPEATEEAVAIGRELVRRAHRGDYPGLSWPDDPGQPPLCGLGHGASGIGLALAELWLATGDMGFLEAARQAADYERAWYNREWFNWPDLRELTRERLASGNGPSHPAFWCHGAVGIGLVRLRWFELTGERRFAAEAHAALEGAERALEGLTRADTPPDLSQCHGLSAFVELFLEAARTFDEPRFRDRAVACAEVAAEFVEEGTWPSGVPDGGENPSLMLGVAGTGMMFLRVAHPGVAPVGLLFTEPIMRERVIVQLAEMPAGDFADAARRLVEGISGARVERISPRGRILIGLPAALDATETAARLQGLEGVAYAEPDRQDRPADPEDTLGGP